MWLILSDEVRNITRMDKESFVGAFGEWYERNKDVINERVHDKRVKKKTLPYCGQDYVAHT